METPIIHTGPKHFCDRCAKDFGANFCEICGRTICDDCVPKEGKKWDYVCPNGEEHKGVGVGILRCGVCAALKTTKTSHTRPKHFCDRCGKDFGANFCEICGRTICDDNCVPKEGEKWDYVSPNGEEHTGVGIGILRCSACAATKTAKTRPEHPSDC